MNIIKRSSKEVRYDGNRIIRAVNKAAMETETGVDDRLAKQIEKEIRVDIEESLLPISVENIQDMVEDKLLISDRKDIAKRFILYRSERAKVRDKKNNKYKLLDDEFISQYKHKKPPFTNLGHFVYLRTYSRFLPEENRREKWYETVRRAVEYNCTLIPNITKEEAQKLYDNIFHLRQFLSGRTLFTGGTEVSKKYGMSNYNCSFCVADDFERFSDMFYLLLIGAGVGVRARKEDVEKLPKVRGDIKIIHKAYAPVAKDERKEYTAIDFEDDMCEITISDSKEAWCQALEVFLKLFYSRQYNKVKTIILNYDNIRQKGERLKTFGGYSSGHQSMLRMLEGIYKVLVKDNKGLKSLKPIDVLDISNIIGQNVVSGGVRRTSEVILFDYDDKEIYEAKSNLYQQIDGEWKLNDEISHRAMSNNSIQYDEKPSREQWHKHIQEMRYSGEPAFQNMIAAKKRREDAQGGNPLTLVI